MGMILVGITGMAFLIVFGVVWLIGSYILSNVIDALPPLSADNDFAATQASLTQNIKTIILWVPGPFFLFFVIKLLLNASRRGSD